MATTQFCLTNAGTNLVGPTVSLLSDLDNFTTEFQTGISLSSLQPPNCPATVTVPDGATQVKVYDPATNVCATVNLDGNDLCALYNLTIDTYQSTTISQIIFGTFTTSFGPVNDYLIYWYRNGSTTPQYISGKGTLFAPYSFTHPLTGAGAILAQSGTYSIKIAKIQINGINFSTLDTPPAGFIKATTSCIPTVFVQVSALNCSNGNFTPNGAFFNYTHKFEFNNASVGTTPQSLSTTFDLSLTTNYLAFLFAGDQVYDILKIVFYGGNYVDPIILENIAIGSNAFDAPGSGSLAPNAVLKARGNITQFKKVLNLSTLNRSPSDYLSITVTPNPTFNNTIWTLYLKCLDTFNCTDCTDQFVNQHPKIYATDTLTSVDSCFTNAPTTKMQACSSTELISDTRMYLDLTSSILQSSNTTPPYKKNISTPIGINANIRTCSLSYEGGTPQICATNPQGTTTVTTSVSNGVFTFTLQFSNAANFNTVTQNFLTEFNNQRTMHPNYNNPQYDDYFQYSVFSYPNGQGCGDTVQPATIRLPIRSNYVIDNTTNTLTVTFTQISTSDQNTFLTFNSITNCDTGCQSGLINTVSYINNQFTAPSVNLTNNFGGYYNYPFFRRGGLTLSPPVVRDQVVKDSMNFFVYSNTTYMMTEAGQLINTTPIKVCDYDNLGYYVTTNPSYNVSSSLDRFYRDGYHLIFSPRVPFNPTYPDDFTIYCRPIINGKTTLTNVVIYEKLNGLITTNNNYVI